MAVSWGVFVRVDGHGMGMGRWTDQIEQRSERGESGVEVDIAFLVVFCFGLVLVGLKKSGMLGWGVVMEEEEDVSVACGAKNDSMMGFRIGDKLELLDGGLSIREGAWGCWCLGQEDGSVC